MANRFDYDDFDDENFSELNEDEITEYSDFIRILEINFLRQKANQRLLSKTIKFLEKSFFWKFKSLQTKLNEISQAYLIFQELSEDKGE